MITKYRQNKSDAVYHERMKTLADQAGADETNVNVIMRKYAPLGAYPGTAKEHLDADFTTIPQDLRSMIDLTRRISQLRDRLPRELRDYTPEQLDALTVDELTTILTPPAQPPAQPKEPT